MKYIIIIAVIVTNCTYSCLATNDLYDDVIINLTSERPFRNPDIVRRLELYIKQNNSDDKLTAQITLALYLMDRDTTNMSKEDFEEPFLICRNIIEKNPGTWQAELAKFYMVFDPSYTGNIKQQLKVVNNSISTINFDLLDKTESRVLKAIQRTYSLGEDATWHEILLAIKAGILCKYNRFDDAEKILDSINNNKYKELFAKRIKLGREVQTKQTKQ